MEIIKTGSSNGNGGNIKNTSTKSNFHRDSQRVSVREIISDHFRKNK